MAAVKGASAKHVRGRRAPGPVLYTQLRKAAFLNQIDQFSEAYGGDCNLVTCCCGLLDKGCSSCRKPGVAEQMPNGGMGIGDGCDGQTLSPKLRKISARLALISSAEGAAPYLARTARPVLKGTRGNAVRVRARGRVREPHEHKRLGKRQARWRDVSGPLQDSLEVRSTWPLSSLFLSNVAIWRLQRK